MQKNTNKIEEKTVLIAGFILILVVVLVTIVRSTNFSFLKSQQGSQNASSATPTAADNKIDYTTISSTDLQKQILSRQKVVLLDIRPFDSYAAEHIIDTVNVPLDEFPVDAKYDRSYEMVVVSDNIEDPQVSTAVQKLRDENFSNIRVLAGGMSQWKSLGNGTVSYGDPTSTSDQAKVGYMTTDQTKDDLANGKIYILDVRDSSEYAKSHIKDALNIPLNDLEKRRFEIKTNKKFVIVGKNELQEFEAAVQIHDMLLTSTFAMTGSMTEWEQKTFPLETN